MNPAQETHTEAAAAHHRAVADALAERSGETPHLNREAADRLRAEARRIERRKDRWCSPEEFRLRNKLDEYGANQMDVDPPTLVGSLYRYHCGEESLEDMIALSWIEEDDITDAIEREEARRPRDVQLVNALCWLRERARNRAGGVS